MTGKSKKGIRMQSPVEILEYDPEWPRIFEKEKVKIIGVLRDKAVAVEHVGSTAVQGLGAKPIIDITVGIRDLSDAKGCIGPLESIGYEYVPEYEVEIPERRYFRKGPSNVPNKHYHLHMVEHGGDFWQRHLLFRDYLRVHTDVALDYYRLKKELAAKYRMNRKAYTEAKSAFVEAVIAKAKLGWQKMP